MDVHITAAIKVNSLVLSSIKADFRRLIIPQTVWKGAIGVASVRPSVCLSIIYIVNNSKTQRPSVLKFWRKVPHIRCDSHTRFKVKQSKVGGEWEHTMSAKPASHTAYTWIHYKSHLRWGLGFARTLGSQIIRYICDGQTDRQKQRLLPLPYGRGIITRGQSNLTKSASRGPIPRLGVTPGGRKLYHWIPGVGFPISVP